MDMLIGFFMFSFLLAIMLARYLFMPTVIEDDTLDKMLAEDKRAYLIGSHIAYLNDSLNNHSNN